MKKFRYYICERDLIEIARGNMESVTWYVKNPKHCQDIFCAVDSILDVLIEVTNPIKDGKSKSSRQKLDRPSKKRKVAPKKLP